MEKFVKKSFFLSDSAGWWSDESLEGNRDRWRAICFPCERDVGPVGARRVNREKFVFFHVEVCDLEGSAVRTFVEDLHIGLDLTYQGFQQRIVDSAIHDRAEVDLGNFVQLLEG